MACAPRLAEALEKSAPAADDGVSSFIWWALGALGVVGSLAVGFLWGRRSRTVAEPTPRQSPVVSLPPPLLNVQPNAPQDAPIAASLPAATPPAVASRKSPPAAVADLTLRLAPRPTADADASSETVHETVVDLSGAQHAVISEGDEKLFSLRSQFGKKSTITYVIVRTATGTRVLWASPVRIASYEGLLNWQADRDPSRWSRPEKWAACIGEH